MKTNIKKTTKVLSIFLSALMLFYAVPLAGFASTDVSAQSEALPTYDATDILCEDVSLREENVKYFLRFDGTRTAAVYDTPVHYLDGNGVWQEYDNSLVESNTLLPDSFREYSPVSSDIDIKLSKKAKSGKMITLGDTGLSWGYQNVSNSTAYIETADSIITDYKNKELGALAVKNASSKVVYPEIYTSVDLEVLVCSTGVKENIVLNSASSQRSFTLEYKTDGDLVPVREDARTIILADADGNTVHTISAPCMYDANGETSDALTLTIGEFNNKKFTVTLTADGSWLDSSERAYPVVLDPMFTYRPASSDEVYETTGVYLDTVPSAYTESGENKFAKVGRKPAGGVYAETVTLSRHTLPSQIDDTSRIIDARIYLYYYAVYSAITTCTVDLQINAYMITEPWTWSGANNVLCNSTLPDYSERVLDYVIANETNVDANDESTYYEHFDITEAAQSWLDGKAANYGIFLRSKNPPSYENYVRFLTSRHSRYSLNPAFVYNYRDTNGLESYWTYYSFGAGRSGAGYVNSFSGSLIKAEPLFSSSGNRNPYSVSLVYNSTFANSRMTRGFSAGYGWMLDGQQRVDAVTDEELLSAGYDYIWTDTDGTEHYFRKKADTTGVWVDEDGLDLELTVSGSALYIRSESGYELRFNTPADGGWLYHAKDQYGNTTRYHYENPNGYSDLVLTKIVSASGKTTTLEYTGVAEGNSSYPRLAKITDPGGRVYTLTYTSSHYLDRITYPDGTYTDYDYTNGRISQITALSKRISISYSVGQNNIYRVSRIGEYAYDSTTGTYVAGENSISFSYDGSNTTTLTDAEGRRTTYVFDSAGRPTSVIAPDGSVASANYHKETGLLSNAASASSINNNKLTAASASPAYVKNYLKNPNMEGDTGYVGTCLNMFSPISAPYSVDTTTAYLGSKSLKLSNTNLGITDSLYRQNVESTEFSGGYVTVSAYVKTEGVVATSSGGGAGFLVTFYDEYANYLGEEYCGNALCGTNDWQRRSFTVEVPAEAQSINVAFYLLSATGTAWFDCGQVEASKTLNTLNLLEDSSFEGTSSWSGGGLGTADTLGGDGYIEIKGESAKNKYVYQYINVNRKSACFSLIARAQADGLANEYAEALLEAEINYADGTGTEWQKISFNPYCADETQQILLNIKPSRTDVAVSSIGFYLIYRYNENSMRITDVMMSMDESGTAYGYDSEGNLISAADNAQRNQTYSYNDVGEITQYTDVKNNSYYYGYNDQNKHQLEYMYSNATNRGFGFEYDGYGNVTGVHAGYIDPLSPENNYIDSFCDFTSMSYGYDSTGDHLTSVTDERGLTTLYGIDTMTGLLNSATVPASVLGVDKNLITRYTYDSGNYNLLSAGLYSSDAPNTLISGVSYTYNTPLAQLSKITRSDSQVYNFLYDLWGRVTDIKVGNRLLSHSAYRKTNSNDTQLSYTEYGNGDKIYYVFDALDRVIAERTGADTEPYVSYDYNSEGLVGRVTDNLAGNVTEYQYDLLGRLVSSNRSDGSIDRYFYSYDESNNLTEMDAYLRPYNAWRLQCRYYYGADNLQTMSEQGNYLIYYYYDDLNRLYSTKAVEVTDGAEFYTIYSYLWDSNTGNSTSFVSKVTYRHRPSGGSISTVGTIDYTYDKNGFISSVTAKNASGTVLSSESYTYDALGQIKTVTRGSDVTEYTYDNSGNILTKKVNGTVVGSYTYGDSNWKDLLTAYNGTSITYDGIGNPTSYIGWDELTWSMGRRLTALSNDTDSITYNYDAAGQRVSKTVNGTKTEFYYDDRGSLILSKTGNTEIYFYPDADGSIGSINYLGNRYYYVRNAQNDIIGITDKTGAFVVRYTYDEWGNITSITDGNGNDVSSNANHLANLNPLRYRSYFYDAETGWYWLNTRYYNPEVGRFINADGLLSTGQGVLGHNMFAYCGNNPVVMMDEYGLCHGYANDPNLSSPTSGVRYGYPCGSYGIHVRNPRSNANKLPAFLDWLFNKEYTFTLYDSARHKPRSPYHEQGVIFSFDTPTCDINEGEVGFGSVSADLYTGGWKGQNYDLSLFDFGHTEAGFMYKDKKVQFGAFASIWSPSVSFSVFGLDFEFGAEIGAVGVGGHVGAGGFGLSVGLGGGFCFDISWDD